MNRISFDEGSLTYLSAIPAAAHQENVARDVLRAAWRRRRLVLGVAIATALLALGVMLQRPVRYPAEALVELTLGRSAGVPTGEAGPAAVVVEAASIVLGEARIARSRLVAHRVVEKLGLADDPAFTGEGARSRASRWLQRILAGEPVETDAAARLQRAAAAERALAASLSVETDNRSYLISITYMAREPDLAARVANAVAEEYLAGRLESALTAAGRTMEALNGQIAGAEVQLQAAEAAVADFRERTGLVEIGVQDDNLQRRQLRDFAAQLNALTLARLAEEGKLARVRTLLRDGVGGAAPELQAMPLVQAALQREMLARRELADAESRLGPKHPTVLAAQQAVADAEAMLAGAVDRAVLALQAGLTTMRVNEEDLRARVEAMQRAVGRSTADEAELRTLQANAASLRERISTLTRSRDQAMVMRGLRLVPASLIMPAQPVRQPVGPGLLVISLGAFIAGMIAGITLAALLDRFDGGLRTSEEVTAVTGLRCLGLLPELAADDPLLETPNRPTLSAPQVMFDESVRMVGSSIGLFGTGHGDSGRIVLVTSAVPGEGRSTLCAGLARTLSLAGRRVLLIDGPPRRFNQAMSPEPSAASDIEPTEGTLHRGPIQEDAMVVLQRNSRSALSVDVFGSPRLAATLEQARKHFDVILIEGPPVMLVADALVLGRMADAVIHVVRWADTKRSIVRAALQRLQEHSIVADGVVLTRIDVEKHAKLSLADQGSYHLRPHGYYDYSAMPAAARLPPVVRR